MVYIKQNFKNGQILDADDLNYMEDGIVAMNETINKITGSQVATYEQTGIVKPSDDFDIAEDGTLSLYKAISITSLSSDRGSSYEMGQAVADWTVTWTLNKAALSQTLKWTCLGQSETVDLDSGLRTATKNASLGDGTRNANATAVLVVTDAREAIASKSVSINWYNGVYYGAAASGAIDNSFLQSLTKSLQSGRGKSFTVTANAGQYIWYACPTSYGTPSFKVGGFDGGFSKVSTLDYTNVNGYTTSYQVWRSDNTGLGTTTVSVS